MENKIKIEQRSLIVILALLVLIASASIYEHKEQARREACVQMKNELIQGTFGSAISGIQAHSFFAYDFTQSLPLYGKNENEPRPLASLTKLMTVRLALEHGSPTDFYTVRNHDLDSDAFAGFAIGDSYRIEDLIRAALIGSVNDAAMMLARSTGATDSAFVDSMNFESAHLGFSSLHFGNPTGLDINDDTVATAFGSAHEILSLLYVDYRDFPEMISLSTHKEDVIEATNGRTIQLKNTDQAIDKLPLLLGSKTGYTDTAGGNLAVLWREPSGDTLGAAVLGSTEEGRFSDMVAIHDAANAYTLGIRSLPKFCKP